MASVSSALSDYYAKHGNWQTLKQNPRIFHDILRQQGKEFARRLDPIKTAWPDDSHKRPPHLKQATRQAHPRHQRKGFLSRRSPNDLFILYDQNQELITGLKNADRDYKILAIVVDKKNVGYLHYIQWQRKLDDLELSFVEKQRQQGLIILGLLLVFAVLFSFPLSRNLVHPIKQLANKTKEISQGNYNTHPPIQRRDEIGDLAKDIHLLSRKLQENQTMRQRWMADTSHELRTPVSILQAQIEAMQDGIRELNQNNLKEIHQELLRLTRLIDDLHQLSLADLGSLEYKMETLNLSKLLQNAYLKHQPALEKKALKTHIKIQPDIAILGDHNRLQQLFDNLISNNLKYTLNGGELFINLDKKNNTIIVQIADSGPGVSNEQITYLFDYLYRTEQSRNRANGGSGLGLSICQRIVEAHSGKIHATHAKEGGLAITLTFPIPQH